MIACGPTFVWQIDVRVVDPIFLEGCQSTLRNPVSRFWDASACLQIAMLFARCIQDAILGFDEMLHCLDLLMVAYTNTLPSRVAVGARIAVACGLNEGIKTTRAALPCLGNDQMKIL
jgi:hypothetical protein